MPTLLLSPIQITPKMNEDDQLLEGDEQMDQEVISPDEVNSLLDIPTVESIDKSIKEGERQLEKLKADLLAAKSKSKETSKQNEPNYTMASSIPSQNAPHPTNATSDQAKIPKLMDLVTSDQRRKQPSGGKTDGPSSSTKPSYAAKTARASGPHRTKEIVEDFLHIYSSRNKKTPISRDLWEHVDNELITLMADKAELGLSNPGERVAHSGFDSAHGCGFIACRDPTSAAWFKEQVSLLVGPDGESFRAWGKTDVPVSRLCRIYIPDRFKRINDARILPIIMGLNSPLQGGDIVFKSISHVNGGRAMFIEVDMDTYAFIRRNLYKLDWLLGSVDCHGIAPTVVAQPVQPTPQGIEGISKLPDFSLKAILATPLLSQTKSTPSTSTQMESSDSDDSSLSSGAKKLKKGLAFSPLTPVKEARALEEEDNESPKHKDPRKRGSNSSKSSKSPKNRRNEPKENFYKKLNKSK
jgi:hypothetical protein